MLEKLFKSRIIKYTDDYFTPMEFPKIVSTFVYNYTRVLRVLINEICILSQNWSLINWEPSHLPSPLLLINPYFLVFSLFPLSYFKQRKSQNSMVVIYIWQIFVKDISLGFLQMSWRKRMWRGVREKKFNPTKTLMCFLNFLIIVSLYHAFMCSW